jgi:hypothetical protein
MQARRMTYIKDILEARELLPVGLQEMEITTPVPRSVGEVVNSILEPLMALKTMVFRTPSSWHLGNQSSRTALRKVCEAAYNAI